MDINGKVALVTGAARRVGRALALALAERGVAMIVHYHTSRDEAQQTASEIDGMGVRAMLVQADLADPAQIEAMFAQVEQEVGGLDILVNSASSFEKHDILTVTPAEWDHTFAVNLRAPLLCSQHAARLMPQAPNSGVIINLLDAMALRADPSYGDHRISKAALASLTRTLAFALAPRVRVNAVLPGLVMQSEGPSDAEWAAYVARTPLKQPGTPEHVAQAMLALIDNDFATGTVFSVDGGESLRLNSPG